MHGYKLIIPGVLLDTLNLTRGGELRITRLHLFLCPVMLRPLCSDRADGRGGSGTARGRPHPYPRACILIHFICRLSGPRGHGLGLTLQERSNGTQRPGGMHDGESSDTLCATFRSRFSVVSCVLTRTSQVLDDTHCVDSVVHVHWIWHVEIICRGYAFKPWHATVQQVSCTKARQERRTGRVLYAAHTCQVRSDPHELH